MDLNKSKKCLENKYYQKAPEYIEDFNTITSNFYLYKPAYYNVLMAQTPETLFMQKLFQMPQEQVVGGKERNGKKDT